MKYSCREATFQEYSNKAAHQEKHKRAQEVQKNIWSLAREGCTSQYQQRGCFLLLSALNTMFEVGNTRYENAEIHPPMIIFILLTILAMLGALLSGYSIGEKKKENFLFLLSYALVIAIIVYIIIDMEFPRLGFIRVDFFDQVLIQIYQGMP